MVFVPPSLPCSQSLDPTCTCTSMCLCKKIARSFHAQFSTCQMMRGVWHVSTLVQHICGMCRRRRRFTSVLGSLLPLRGCMRFRLRLGNSDGYMRRTKVVVVVLVWLIVIFLLIDMFLPFFSRVVFLFRFPRIYYVFVCCCSAYASRIRCSDVPCGSL